MENGKHGSQEIPQTSSYGYSPAGMYQDRMTHFQGSFSFSSFFVVLYIIHLFSCRHSGPVFSPNNPKRGISK